MITPDGKFWFWDETGVYRLGPFPSQEECNRVAILYGNSLTDGTEPPCRCEG